MRPSREDLLAIFKELDTDGDGFITFQQYSDFIQKYLGNGLDLSSSRYSSDLTGVSEKELAFVQAIWDELKAYFVRYDTGKKGHLKESELRGFVIEVLQETTERELNYVFWNLSRVDTDSNKEVDFLEFVQLPLCLGTLHPQPRRRNLPATLPQTATRRQDRPRLIRALQGDQQCLLLPIQHAQGEGYHQYYLQSHPRRERQR